MRRQASVACFNLIRESEGYSSVVYLCPAGDPSIGYGHKIRPTDKLDPPISQARALSLLIADLAPIEIYLTGVLPGIPQCQFDALASFIFNVGLGNFEDSTLLKKLKAGDIAGAADEFPRWVHAEVDGVRTVLPGLVSRRAAERALFLNLNPQAGDHS